VENRFFFKIGLKAVQLTEIVEAEAILSGTEQIQLEMVPKMLKYYSFGTLSRFLCQEKREKYYFVIIKRANILGCRGECILP
jgi:hypothetical protein